VDFPPYWAKKCPFSLVRQVKKVPHTGVNRTFSIRAGENAAKFEPLFYSMTKNGHPTNHSPRLNSIWRGPSFFTIFLAFQAFVFTTHWRRLQLRIASILEYKCTVSMTNLRRF